MSTLSGPHDEDARLKKASHLASQPRAGVDAVVHVEGARGSAVSTVSAGNHMSLLRLAHVRSTRKLCGLARVGVRDKVGPQCVTERSTHLLGNARERPALALQYSLARHLGQFDRLGGLVRTHAMIWSI